LTGSLRRLNNKGYQNEYESGTSKAYSVHQIFLFFTVGRDSLPHSARYQYWVRDV